MIRPASLAIAFVVLSTLACGGGGGGSTRGGGGPPDLAFEPQEAPAAVPKADEGLGAELGFPYVDGIVRVNEPTKVHVLHPSTFDAGIVWEPYAAGLEAAGWERARTAVPPFKGLFTKEKRRVLVTAELAGSSVWVKAELLK